MWITFSFFSFKLFIRSRDGFTNSDTFPSEPSEVIPVPPERVYATVGHLHSLLGRAKCHVLFKLSDGMACFSLLKSRWALTLRDPRLTFVIIQRTLSAGKIRAVLFPPGLANQQLKGFLQGCPKSMPALPKKIFIVEDHPVFREGLAQAVSAEQGLTVCGQAGSAAQALRTIPKLKPDLVLVDITLPGKSGLQLIKELRAMNLMIKLLVVSMHDEALYAARVLRAGGDGYIMKQENMEEILQAIHDLLSGRLYVSEEVLASLPKSSRKRRGPASSCWIHDLTDLELEFLELLGRGKGNRAIARQLRLPLREIVARGTQIRKKLRLRSISELIRYAVCWVEESA